MLLYEMIQVLIALIAVVLAIKWKRPEFLAGLGFLFIYTILNLMDVSYFLIKQQIYIDFAQFGFIPLAIILFIIGMHPSWSRLLVSGKKGVAAGEKSQKSDSILNDLRKL
jgi:intracellular septation protein A